jgi:CPA2 family monovalent cation:H+ antiporter-2
MHAELFLQDLAIIMMVAGLVTVLFHRLKLPVVPGYILAGLIIGPHTPPFALIHDLQTIHTLAELGVVFLLFSLGLEFNLKKLGRVGAAALVAATIETSLMIWVGYQIGRYFGWQAMDAVFLGAMMAISSTTVIVKTLGELGLKNQKFAHYIFGILIVEDILAIAILALLSGVAGSGGISFGSVAKTLAELALFMVVTLVVGILAIPRLLTYVASFRSQETLLVAVLGLCFGFCLLVTKLHYSMALGAFLMGAIIAESRQLRQIERLVEPLRDMFSAIFFVAVGLLLNPQVLVDYAVPVLVITLAVIAGKVAGASFGLLLAGQNGSTALRAGFGLAQIGEFSFIIASLGVSLKVTSDFLFPIAVAVSTLTAFFGPWLMKSADPLSSRLGQCMPRRVVGVWETYDVWLQSLSPQNEDEVMLAKMIRRILVHAFVNLALVIAIFVSAAAFFDGVKVYLPQLIRHEGLEMAAVWAGALFLSLPFLIAAYRKLKALSMLLAEMGVKPEVAGQYTAQARKVVSELIPIVAMLVMVLLVAALSASILPPAPLLVAVLVGMGLLLPLLWKRFVRLHSRLQIALMETLEEEGGE